MCVKEKFPELSQNDIKIINQCFTTYLFYSSTTKGKEFWCTDCREHFTLQGRLDNREEYNAFHGNHNQVILCPRCGKVAILKNVGRSKSRKNLWEEKRVVFLRVKSVNKVIAQCYECTKSYMGQILPFPVARECSRYILTPGNAKKFKKSYYYDDWHEEKSVRVPFFIKSGIGWYSAPDNSYTVVGLNKLNKTFLKYQMLDDYEKNLVSTLCGKVDIKIMSYLCRFAEHPQIEMLQKLGHYDVVRALVERNIKSFSMVNWKASSPPSFFKLSPQEYKEFRASGGKVEILKLRRKLKEVGVDDSIKNTVALAKKIDNLSPSFVFESVTDRLCSNNISMSDGIKYLLKQMENIEKSFYSTCNYYFDYFDAAKELEYDLLNPTVLFPKNLIYHHDRAIENHRAFLEAKRAQELKIKEVAAQKTLKKYDKKYCYTDGEFAILVPHSINEIIREGKLQKHCVGGYAARHMDGALAICFLRCVSNIEKPLYTIEMHGKQMVQVQGYGNKTPLTPKAQTFFNKWLNWVKQGSKRTKDGMPVIVNSKIA